MQGSRWRYRGVLVGVLGLVLAGCSHLPGGPTLPPALVLVPTDWNAVSVVLADLPPGYLLATETQPTDAQVWEQRGTPTDAALLSQAQRLGGDWRLFLDAPEAPTVQSATVRATVAIDIFGSVVGASAWFDHRAGVIATLPGTPLPAPAPGQRHVLHVQTYGAGSGATMTHTILAFIERNAVVEITTTTVGPGESLADPTRFADLIDSRLLHPASD